MLLCSRTAPNHLTKPYALEYKKEFRTGVSGEKPLSGKQPECICLLSGQGLCGVFLQAALFLEKFSFS
ncbi:hypothetical protein D7X87_11320 [bacterium D16-54]|nr:hypothetical protein D7X87_11320 [bacterium D16-54]RKJ14349.1 hypothetical protein D7X65_11915 [bacterium D16-56]